MTGLSSDKASRKDGITVGLRKVRRALLLRLFNGLYRAGRWIYDPLTVAFFGSSWHEWRQTALPWILPGRTLELGCGTGALLPEIGDRSGHTVGLDVTASMLAQARFRTSRSDIDLVLADGSTLPFSGETFDSVLATFPSGYIASAATKNEISRVLRPGGLFIVVASAAFRQFQWRRPFIHPVLRLAYGTGQSMNRWPPDLLYHHELPGSWHDLTTREGVAFVWIARKASL